MSAEVPSAFKRVVVINVRPPREVAAENGVDHRLPSQRGGSVASLSLAEANHFLRSSRRFLNFRFPECNEWPALAKKREASFPASGDVGKHEQEFRWDNEKESDYETDHPMQ